MTVITADINGDLINLYNIVKTRTASFIEDARQLFSASNAAETYYAQRTAFNASTDTYQRAVLFLYLNRHGYNGLCRYNLRGEFNVPFGRYRKPYFPEAELLWFAERAQKPPLSVNRTMLLWATPLQAQWFIAIRRTRRCRRRLIYRLPHQQL